MAKNQIKTAGIPRTGFEYQDLIGIEVLLKFYRNSELFEWVKLEADDPKVGKLDDVVAARKDGSFELLQVKFTVDTQKYLLDWDWLLEKKKKGTSLLKKWSEALTTIKSLGSVHSAKLRTNRHPSSAFQLSLNGYFVDFDKIAKDQKAKLSSELGDEAAARDFFNQFEFAHSEQCFDDLEARLKGDIVPTDTNNTGWLLLRDQARRWATRKTQPEPDGRIRHEHLVQIINKQRPKPIPQGFAVPSTYRPPKQDFHESFWARTKSGQSQISILWGSPGRGKSTYLSHLVQTLRDLRLPVVRHHYFLSLEDGTSDRVSFSEICSSLMDQMSGFYPEAVRGLEDSPNRIREWLTACGKHFAETKKRFYLVIDGLDHVWREQQNISQMEHLFNYLLPCPDNVFLLVGTQKVPANHLPLKLSQHASDADWIEVPPMDEVAVHHWLTAQHNAGRLLLRDLNQFHGKTELTKIGQAFFEISKGNPLHLIYSFEALLRRGAAVTAEDVNSLPECPDGDIRKYYRVLWTRLSANSRKIIHLIAGSDFHWPPDGLRKCVGPVDEVDHLLELRRTGLIPFHGSILAFAREQDEHNPTFQTVLPAVVKWLESGAPEYWRWAWLWILRAKSGDDSDLLSLTTRDWVLHSLAKGWPVEQITTILETAEQVAFNKCDLVRTIQIRSLKTRILNGPEHQTNRFHDFQECAIRTAKNEQQIYNLADGLASAADDEVVALARCLDGIDTDGIGTECIEELRAKVNLWIGMNQRVDEEFYSLAERLIEVLVEFGSPDLSKLCQFIEQFQARDRIYQTFLRHVVRTRNLEATCNVLEHLDGDGHSLWRYLTERAIVQIASAEEADISLRLSPKKPINPILSCWFRLRGLKPPQRSSMFGVSGDAVRKEYEYGPNPLVERFLHSFFFLALDTALESSGECEPALIGIDRTQLGWLQDAIKQLWSAAFSIAQRPNDMDFGSIFIELYDLEPVDVRLRHSEPASAQYRALRAVLPKIAADLHSLNCAQQGSSHVTKNSFELARASLHWLDEIWVEQELNARSRLIEPDGVYALISDLSDFQAKHVTQFSERTERWTDLAQLSLIYGLPDASMFVHRAADCIVGYIWRKDVTIFEYLSAVESVHKNTAADIKPWLRALAPFIDQITNFTDGDETNHAPEEFISIVAQASPEWLPDCYAYYVANEEYGLAEETLAAILGQLDFTDVASVALVGSLLESGDLSELEKLKKSGKSGVAALLHKQKRFLGINKSRQKVANKPNAKVANVRNSEFGETGTPPDVRKFGPNELDKLLRRLARPKLGYKHRDACLVRWLKHWDGKKKGLTALKAIDDYFSTHDNPHDIEPLLDEAFEVSLKNEGKKKAYRWLVRTHVEHHSWQYYWDRSERVQKRIELAAKYYKDKWFQYIQDTSKPARYWEKRRSGFTIGHVWLVRYLILVGQKTLAIQLTDEMVKLFVEEVHDQPIPALEWLP